MEDLQHPRRGGEFQSTDGSSMQAPWYRSPRHGMPYRSCVSVFELSSDAEPFGYHVPAQRRYLFCAPRGIPAACKDAVFVDQELLCLDRGQCEQRYHQVVCRHPENEVLMIQHKGYKYRIYPNKAQAVILSQFFGCCRFVYNRCLSYRKEVYASDKRNVSQYECMRLVTQMRHDPDCEFL